MRSRMTIRALSMILLVFAAGRGGHAQWTMSGHLTSKLLQLPESSSERDDSAGAAQEQPTYQNAWGLDILISNNGLGLGTFYRREFTQDIFGSVSFSISESKDEREVELFDPYLGESFTPGKLNRFLVIPLLLGVQYRVFREDIMDTFRPYVNAGAGPTMIFAAPFIEVIGAPPSLQFRQVEFFSSLGKGQAHYTAGGFIGFGANFGTEKSNVFGVNFRYYFTYLFSDGLASRYDNRTGKVLATKNSFGGFFITLNVGMAY